MCLPVADIQNAYTCNTHMTWHGFVAVLCKHVVFKKTVRDAVIYLDSKSVLGLCKFLVCVEPVHTYFYK